jgi:hypothetical protein
MHAYIERAFENKSAFYKYLGISFLNFVANKL